jgi:hypothetical protein
MNEKQTMEIITGTYGTGTEEQNEIVDVILGKQIAKESFEIYFHWYNIMHELGHGIMNFNSCGSLHAVEEEQLVNDFAVAYWFYYGETEKIIKLKSILDYAMSHLTRPVDKSIDYLTYAIENWGKEELFTFNNYGWFQFSCVLDSLSRNPLLESVLGKMGINDVRKQEKKTLYYRIDTHMPEAVVENAVSILREWGVFLPDVSVTFDKDPNRHMLRVF